MENRSPEPAELSDEEMFAELDRRAKEFETGTADAIPWYDLKKER